MTITRGRLSEADLDAFLSAGYTRAQALEVVAGVAVSVLANYANHLTDAPLDAFLQPQAWSAEN
jgi:alkylhydroperoxidase family enzyme